MDKYCKQKRHQVYGFPKYLKPESNRFYILKYIGNEKYKNAVIGKITLQFCLVVLIEKLPIM